MRLFGLRLSGIIQFQEFCSLFPSLCDFFSREKSLSSQRVWEQMSENYIIKSNNKMERGRFLPERAGEGNGWTLRVINNPVLSWCLSSETRRTAWPFK